jgi:hypothetical protein
MISFTGADMELTGFFMPKPYMIRADAYAVRNIINDCV